MAPSALTNPFDYNSDGLRSLRDTKCQEQHGKASAFPTTSVYRRLLQCRCLLEHVAGTEQSISGAYRYLSGACLSISIAAITKEV